MQPGAVANRIRLAAHQKTARPVIIPNQIVIDDWILRNWVTDGTAPAWAAPTTSYTLTGTANGDFISKGATPWDFGFQDLGVNTPVLLPDGVTTDTPYVSSVPMTWPNAGTQDLVVFYARNFQNGWDAGIYATKCTDDGAGHLFWSQPIVVDERVPIADFNNQSQLFCTFPRVQVINGEFWILALECSLEVIDITYHVVYYRSTDGEHWSRKEYLAGVSNDPSEVADALAGNSINQHDNGTLFVLNDLKHAYLTVSGLKVFMVSKTGSKFSCPATSLVGVSNPSLTLDVTKQAAGYPYSRPTAPGGLQARTTLRNVGKMFDGSPILYAGARMVRQAGYQTSNGNEVVTLSTEFIDTIDAKKTISPGSYQDTLELSSSDGSLRLRDLSEDSVTEYNSPKQSAFETFCDLTALAPQNGSVFYVNLDGTTNVLTCAPQDPNGVAFEAMGYIPQGPVQDGSMEFRFRFAGNVNIANTAAVVFAGDKSQGERSFYSVAYWVVLGKWVIVRAIPSTTGRKIYTYDVNIIFTGSAQALSPDTWYWLKVQQYHNHVMAWTSPDHITWTNMIDYQVVNNPTTSIPAVRGFWGMLGHSVTNPSTGLGNIDGSAGKQDLSDGAGNPKFWAVKFTTGAQKGMFNSIAAMITQTGQPGPITFGIAKDDGTGNAPANVNVSGNVIYSVSIPSLNFSSSDSPVGKAFPIPGDLRSAASTVYWIFVVMQAANGAGQTYEWYSAGSAISPTVSSSNGSTWVSVAGKSFCAVCIIDYDGGLTEFSKMYWTSAERTHTLEDLAHSLAAKAHVLNISPDSWVATGDLVAGWAPASFGTLGDFVLDCDVSGAGAEIYFRATTQGNPATGYKLVMGATLALHRNGVQIYSISSMQAIPSSYHLRVTNQTNWVQVWINDALAGTFYDVNLTTPGFFGVGVATFTNLRIPDMTSIKPYHWVDEGEPAMSALSKLVDKTRFKFFVRYDGSLRIGSFLRRTSVDTYSDTVMSTGAVDSSRYVINQIKPTSSHFAMAWLGRMLQKFGLRYFKKFDYTAAFSNEDALKDSASVMRLTSEQGQSYVMESSFAVFPAELEDRITNSLDGRDYIVNDITITMSLGKVRQKLGLRRFIS